MSNNKKDYSHPLDSILDRPIAFQRAFKNITKNTVAALFLSQAWYWSKRHNEDDGWFYNTQEDWEEETGLTRYEQETARKILRRLGILEEKLVGVPARLYYRVNKGRIAEMLNFQFGETPHTSLGENCKQDRGISPNINKNPETSAENAPMQPEPIAESQEPAGADAPARVPSADTVQERIDAFPQDVQLGVQLIYQYFQVIPPVRPATQARGGSYALWLRDVRELIRTAAEYGSSLEAALRLTYNSWNSSPFRVSHPGALKKTMVSALAQSSLSKSKTNGDSNQRSESPLNNFKPRGQS
jgi:hypothetical protein